MKALLAIMMMKSMAVIRSRGSYAPGHSFAHGHSFITVKTVKTAGLAERRVMIGMIDLKAHVGRG